MSERGMLATPGLVRVEPGRRTGTRSAPPRATVGRVVATVAAACAVAAWGAWWVKSVKHDRLVYGRLTWTPILPFLGGDFKVHIDHTARIWAAGGDVYSADDWVCALFPYPPMIPRLFGWVSLMGTRAATATWIGTLAAIFALSSWGVARARRGLGLTSVPWPWLLAATLWATPTITAMERGQADPLVIPLLGLAAWLLGRGGRVAEPAAGAVLALAAWTKYYPGLAIVALIGLRRWWALAAFVVVAGAIGVYDLEGVRTSIANGAKLAGQDPQSVFHLHPVQHAIARYWPHLWAGTRLRGLATIPGSVASVLLLLPPILMLGARLDRARRRGASATPLLWPAFLWLTAAGTFAMPYSNDYNLVFLPLAALAAWDRRDPVPVHMAMGLFLLYWQPLAFAIDSRILFAIKLAALYAVAASLIRSADELGRDVASPENERAPAGLRPHLAI